MIIEILGEEVYNNQNNHKPNNRNRRADEALVDRVNHVNGVSGNLNSSIQIELNELRSTTHYSSRKKRIYLA